ncbi:nucleoside triphosphate pyrophosphohydrolase family protein [Bradyrhizobium sp. HKCCYLS2038]|uniref:nucleoside triphosphate pyrophosphohydrolase family protein n=1 Tax=Bradyrhizobium sp. HKCCYLS2038 TaxID=3420764 RepID=UPI003EBB2E11
MTIDEYADWAAGVAGVEPAPSTDKLSYLGLGLVGETGEVADHIKKLLRDGGLDSDGFTEELGDVIYYWACLCVASGQKPSALLAKSREKIAHRIANTAPPNGGDSS